MFGKCDYCNKVKPVNGLFGRKGGQLCDDCFETVYLPKAKIWRKKAHLKYVYGITEEFYQELYRQQNGVCAICRKVETRRSHTGGIGRLSVDHDHNTDQIRGLLCNSCNTLLGQSFEDVSILQEAIDYLNRYKIKTKVS